MNKTRLLLKLCGVVLAALVSACASAGEAPPPAYVVKLEAPRALRDTLNASLDLLRWREFAHMTPELLARLIQEARQQAADALAVEGYFSPSVEIETHSEQSPPEILITVEPGARAKVGALDLTFRGTVRDVEDAAGMERARRAWSLQPGVEFRQADWEAAKQRATTALARNDYAAAKVVASRASVDPETQTVDLQVTFDSGPRFFFGKLVVAGEERYAAERVRHLQTFTAGEPYRLEQLETFQRRLSATNYFASVQLAIDDDPQQAAAAPVRVTVIEALPKRLEIGLGYSTDSRYRTSLIWRDANFLGTAARLRAELRIESLLQRLGAGLDLPEAGDGWRNSLEATAERTDVQNLETRALIVGATRQQLDERSRFGYGLAAYLEQQMPSGAQSSTSHALYPHLDQTWRTIDNLVSPRRGLVLHLHAGAGVPGASTRDFGRGIAQALWFVPLARQHDLMLRGEFGAVLASGRDGIPQALLFRTGGDTSVRGYSYQQLGVRQGDAIVGGRYYALASIEYTRWVTDAWGLATFIDAGNAADRLGALDPKLGYGVGARVNTPIGPVPLRCRLRPGDA